MSGYTDKGFADLLDEVEELLGDLYGIEEVAQAVLDYAYDPAGDGYDQLPKTLTALTLPASTPFEVYPTLPLASAEFDQHGGYQSWVDQVFEVGRLKAAATSAWLKNIATNYYLVDAAAIISGARAQGHMTHQEGVKLSETFVDVETNMGVSWQGEAKREFERWFAVAAAGTSALLWYADSAQLTAGAAGDAIAGVQARLMRQADLSRDAVEEAVKAWKEDNDVFPHPPGSGYTLDQLNSHIADKVHEYTDKVPGATEIVDFAYTQGVPRAPYLGKAVQAYQKLVEFDSADTDPSTPESAATLSNSIEKAITAICEDGDQSLERLADKITRLAEEVASDDVFVLPRLPRDPQGPYDPYAD